MKIRRLLLPSSSAPQTTTFPYEEPLSRDDRTEEDRRVTERLMRGPNEVKEKRSAAEGCRTTGWGHRLARGGGGLKKKVENILFT